MISEPVGNAVEVFACAGAAATSLAATHHRTQDSGYQELRAYELPVAL